MLAFVINLVNDTYMIAEEQPDYLAIHEAFAATEHGQALAANVRYTIYKPDEVSNEEWVELLGPDVNNLTHLVSTYYLSEEFIGHTNELQPDELSPYDEVILQTSAITHDWGEAIPDIGDVNYSDKTEAHETREHQAFIDNLPAFYTGGSSEVEELIKDALEQVIFNRQSRLGRMFNIIERVGYLCTANRASQHLYEGTAPECADGFAWLVADTLSNHQATHVIAAGRRFPAAHSMLESRKSDLNRTFEIGQAAGLAAFARFDPNRAIAKETNLKAASEVWDSWCGEFDDDSEKS